MTKAISKPPSEGAGIDLLSILYFPTDSEEHRVYGEAITAELLRILESKFTAKERAALKSGDVPERQRLSQKMDKVLLDQFPILGWRMFLSPFVLAWIRSHWESAEGDPELLRRMGAELYQGAMLYRGKGKAPLEDPEWYAARNEMVKEMRFLIRAVTARFSSRNRAPTGAQARECILNLIGDPQNDWPLLRKNFTAFKKFLEDGYSLTAGKDEGSLDLADQIAIGNVTAAEVVNAWIAWSTNRTIEKTRQTISLIGSQRAR